jgi:glycosyltransferase involved in cell wall biosynthesis
MHATKAVRVSILSNSLDQNKRVFWLGMHKILSQTELPRLRSLGFEVFNPPYLSDIYDQSANYQWTSPEGSTLPAEALAILSTTNFFYEEIPPVAAEILNTYFETVIVTINPQWLKNILAVYQGRVIYRTYGQPHSLSHELLNNGAFRSIVERDNFWFSPHSTKVLDMEEDWLCSRMNVIPYCLTSDIVSLRDTWSYKESSDEVGLLCPRALDIPYYANSYSTLLNHFPGNHYKIFGAQNIPVDSEKVIGTLDRGAFLKRFRQMRCFVYHYKEPAVCYLPPIEFMTFGGPVIVLDGSLLSRYFAKSTPARVGNFEEARNLAERLRSGDTTLSDEIVCCQQEVRNLYQPEYVWPIFDEAMCGMLGEQGLNKPPALLYSTAKGLKRWSLPFDSEKHQNTVLVAFHAFGPLVARRNGQYHCAEGIARVTRQYVRALLESGHCVVVTSRSSDVGRVHGFFNEVVTPGSVLKVMCVDALPDLEQPTSLTKRGIQYVVSFVKRLRKVERGRLISGYQEQLKLLLANRNYSKLPRLFLLFIVFIMVRFLVKLGKPTFRAIAKFKMQKQVNYVEKINNDGNIDIVLIPHYYLFPELIDIKRKKTLLYLPDYMPHFYKNSLEMGASKTNENIGRKLAEMASCVITNSAFTKEYLPQSALHVSADKILHIPLPFLNNQSDYQFDEADRVGMSLPQYFVHYPTRNRPSKRLRDFVKTIGVVNQRLEQQGRSERVHGLLTSSPPLDSIDNQTKKYILVMEEVSDEELALIYAESICLLFTSEMEGNFPTQVTEALYLKTPIVAANIPLITSELGEVAAALKLLKLGDCESYADRVLDILDDRSLAVEQQAPVRQFAQENFTYEKFRDGLNRIV